MIGHYRLLWFKKSLFENIKKKTIKALILGTGGLQSYKYVLEENSIKYHTVSREKVG